MATSCPRAGASKPAAALASRRSISTTTRYSGRGRGRDGGTQASGSDSGLLGKPAEQLSDRNAPTEHRNGKGEH